MMNSVMGRSLNRQWRLLSKCMSMVMNWVFSLMPKRSDRKKRCSSLFIFILTAVVRWSRKVEMLEKCNGDSTVILLHGVKTNTGINEKVFEVLISLFRVVCCRTYAQDSIYVVPLPKGYQGWVWWIMDIEFGKAGISGICMKTDSTVLKELSSMSSV